MERGNVNDQTIKQNAVSLDTPDFINAVKALGIEGSEVCIHSSMKSFGVDFKCGIEGIVNAFLVQNGTIMVPTFSYIYAARPVKRYMPERNGAGDYSYFLDYTYSNIDPFDITSKEISVESMGGFAKYVLDDEKSIRGNHPLNSFTALGSNAQKLVNGQTFYDVYAPLRQLCDDDGYVLLIGVSLNAATIIHYAEQAAGRIPFIRWAHNKKNTVIPVSVGSCSRGFEHFNDILSNFAKKVKVANSEWTCYKAADIVDVCSAYIKDNPDITHCGDKDCDRCNDAVLGGPILSADIWDNI